MRDSDAQLGHEDDTESGEQHKTDAELLESLDRRLQLLRDRVRGVAERYHTAAYLVGRPGTSKTYTVRDELEKLQAAYIIRNARMTPMGLFELIHEHPNQVIVLDDIGSLFAQRDALQILLAALDGDPASPRRVTYKSKNKEFGFEFTGGVIAISNVALRHDPLASAVASRVVQVEHEPTDEEVAAFMRRLAEDGFKDLTAESCREVVEFVIESARKADQRFDLRHLTNAFDDRRQWESGDAETHWHDLVRSSLRQSVPSSSCPTTKSEEITQQRERVKRAIDLFPDDSLKQIEFSGLKKSTFYKRRREICTA